MRRSNKKEVKRKKRIENTAHCINFQNKYFQTSHSSEKELICIGTINRSNYIYNTMIKLKKVGFAIEQMAFNIADN